MMVISVIIDRNVEINVEIPRQPGWSGIAKNMCNIYVRVPGREDHPGSLGSCLCVFMIFKVHSVHTYMYVR
jgi:hypothetical protein